MDRLAFEYVALSIFQKYVSFPLEYREYTLFSIKDLETRNTLVLFNLNAFNNLT